MMDTRRRAAIASQSSKFTVVVWALSGARLFQFASTLVLFGSAIFSLYGCPDARTPERAWPRWLLPLAAAIGIISTLAWLSAEAASLTGTWTALDAVVNGTRFGQILALRGLLLTLTLIVCFIVKSAKALDILVSILGGLSVASFAWTGHGTVATGSGLHLVGDVLHLLAAGIWLGALVPLSFLLALSIHVHTAAYARGVVHGLARFSAIGPAVVAILTLTGIINTWYLIGLSRWSALFDTTYGLALLAKVGLFFGMLALAASNRWRLTPRLQAALASSGAIGPALRALRASLFAETALAFLVLAIVAVLGILEPPVSAN